MEQRRLRKISDLINQFVASITHKPLESRLDQARVKAFVSALRDCLTTTKRPVELIQPIELSAEEKQAYMKSNIEQLRKMKDQ